MVIEKTRTSSLEGLISRARTTLKSSETSGEEKKILRRLITLGSGIMRQLKSTKEPVKKDIELFDLIKEYAPEGTSDEEIEKQVGVLTRSILRGLGAVGKKLKGFIGRTIQRFGGKEGFWITSRGRRAFIPIGPREAARIGKLQAKEITPAVSRKLGGIGKRRTQLGRKLQRAGVAADLNEVSSVGRDVLGLMADVISFL